MVFGKLTDAVSDLKETLRRVFQDPPSHALETSLGGISPKGVPPLNVAPRAPGFLLEALPVWASLAFPGSAQTVVMEFRGEIQAEEGWARWAAGAKIYEMPVFSEVPRRRMEVPPLPRRPVCRGLEMEGFRISHRSLRPGVDRPVVRGGAPDLGMPVAHGALDLVLGLPIAIQGQDVQTLPKAQWMRYSLQLIKATGENIRNLEVLGLYRIPSQGVGSMRHDASTGRLLLSLTRDASGASRQLFLLARRKDDRTLVSCFLEEG